MHIRKSSTLIAFALTLGTGALVANADSVTFTTSGSFSNPAGSLLVLPNSTPTLVTLTNSNETVHLAEGSLTNVRSADLTFAPITVGTPITIPATVDLGTFTLSFTFTNSANIENLGGGSDIADFSILISQTAPTSGSGGSGGGTTESDISLSGKLSSKTDSSLLIHFNPQTINIGLDSYQLVLDGSNNLVIPSPDDSTGVIRTSSVHLYADVIPLSGDSRSSATPLPNAAWLGLTSLLGGAAFATIKKRLRPIA